MKRVILVPGLRQCFFSVFHLVVHLLSSYHIIVLLFSNLLHDLPKHGLQHPNIFSGTVASKFHFAAIAQYQALFATFASSASRSWVSFA